MKDRAFNALVATSQALSVTSQLLAIGIEVGIIIGGVYIYKKVRDELTKEEPKTEFSINTEQPKPTFKDAWTRTKKIYKAVFS